MWDVVKQLVKANAAQDRPDLGPLEQVPHPYDILEHGGMGDEKNLVEAQLLDPLQALARFVRRADQRDVGHLREAGGFGPVGEIDGDVGEDGVIAARVAIDAHSGFEIGPAAVSARGSPALALFRRIFAA